MDTIHINELPQETLQLIFSYCGIMQQSLELYTVCSLWESIIKLNVGHVLEGEETPVCYFHGNRDFYSVLRLPKMIEVIKWDLKRTRAKSFYRFPRCKYFFSSEPDTIYLSFPHNKQHNIQKFRIGQGFAYYPTPVERFYIKGRSLRGAFMLKDSHILSYQNNGVMLVWDIHTKEFKELSYTPKRANNKTKIAKMTDQYVMIYTKISLIVYDVVNDIFVDEMETPTYSNGLLQKSEDPFTFIIDGIIYKFDSTHKKIVTFRICSSALRSSVGRNGYLVAVRSIENIRNEEDNIMAVIRYRIIKLDCDDRYQLLNIIDFDSRKNEPIIHDDEMYFPAIQSKDSMIHEKYLLLDKYFFIMNRGSGFPITVINYIVKDKLVYLGSGSINIHSVASIDRLHMKDQQQQQYLTFVSNNGCILVVPTTKFEEYLQDLFNKYKTTIPDTKSPIDWNDLESLAEYNLSSNLLSSGKLTQLNHLNNSSDNYVTQMVDHVGDHAGHPVDVDKTRYFAVWFKEKPNFSIYVLSSMGLVYRTTISSPPILDIIGGKNSFYYVHKSSSSYVLVQEIAYKSFLPLRKWERSSLRCSKLLFESEIELEGDRYPLLKTTMPLKYYLLGKNSEFNKIIDTDRNPLHSFILRYGNYVILFYDNYTYAYQRSKDPTKLLGDLCWEVRHNT
eukprot:TRINITY_DN1754_c0_g1_i1.p1 TRINITY_DN1754_c0_g1~~TRINITY_DN1754_c0_g1_i1.p1  ORF type:complete len:671 (+),score=108.76 TRINITY_DN1754_c0_g1_i1:53-2065(+)